MTKHMQISFKDVLEIIAPADKVLQSRTIGFRSAVLVIEAVIENIRKLRETDIFDAYFQKAEQVLESVGFEARPIRTRRRSLQRDSFVTERVGEKSDALIEIKSAYFEAIDKIIFEMNLRFTENSEILLALSTALQFDEKLLSPLKKSGIKVPDSNELAVVKKYIDDAEKKFFETQTQDDESLNNFNVLQHLYAVKDAFKETVVLMEAVETFGCSTAICEASFSSFTRIGILGRICMTSERLRNLSFMAFEYKRLNLIDETKILRAFNNSKQRRLEIF